MTEELAKDLELNELWPIMPVVLSEFSRLVREHKKSGEVLREITLLSKDEKKGTILSDIEQLKIEMKKIELAGVSSISEEEEEQEEG